MAPPTATDALDSELSQLEALPTEVLEKQLEHLPVPVLLRAMSVSRRLSAVVMNILRVFFHTVVPAVQNDKVKVLLTFAPPAYASSSVLCQYAATDDGANDFTTLYSRFCPGTPGPAPIYSVSSHDADILTCEATLDDGESFTQFRVIIRLILTSGGAWFPYSTLIFDGILRLSDDWLSRGAPELFWIDQHRTVGLHILPRPKTVDNRPPETKYYDLQVDELRLRTTRFLKGVEEAKHAQGNGSFVVLRRVEQRGAWE